MLSFQLLSIQIDISWRKQAQKKSVDKIERYLRANRIEKQFNEMKNKSTQYFRVM